MMAEEERVARLQQECAALRRIVDSVATPIFSVDREYRYTSFNKYHVESMASLYGTEVELGRNLLECITVAADRATTKRNIDRALEGETVVEEAFSGEELRLRRYLRVMHNPITDEADEIVGVAVSVHDLTERKRAEEAKASERHYQDIFDNALDSLFLLDVLDDGRFRTIEVNPALERVTGIPRSQSVGKTQEEIVDEETARIVNLKYRRCVEQGRPVEEDVVLDLPAGRRHFHSTLIPARDANGRISRIVGISRDVTEQRRNESLNEARLRLVQFAVGHALDEILEQALNEAEAISRSSIGLAHLMDDDERTLKLQSWSTRTKAEFCTTEGQGRRYPVTEAGVWADCIGERSAVIHNDCAALPHTKGMLEGHVELVRELVVPVMRGDKIKAVFGVGNKPVDYGAEDVEAVTAIADLAWEIAERKLAKEELARVNRALRMLSDSNQALIRATDEVALFREICRIAVETSGYRMAWVGRAEHHDAANAGQPLARAGFEAGFLEATGIGWIEGPQGRGPCGKAIRDGVPCIVREIEEEAAWPVWRREALWRGYRAALALPLTCEGQSFGALGIYAAEPDSFDPHEVAILSELASDLAFGIAALRTRARRDQALFDLARSEQKYRDLLQRIHAAIVVHGADSRIVSSNARAQELFGMTEAQMLGVVASDPDWQFFREDRTVMPPEEYPVHRVLATREPLRDFVVGVPRPSEHGNLWILADADPVIDDEGRVEQVIVTFVDVTERKRAEEERRAHLRFLEGMDRVSRAIQGADDLEQLMSDVLDLVVELLACDRAFLLYPCDPDASEWSVPVERTRPEYPGVHGQSLQIPMDPNVAETLRVLLSSNGPVAFGPGTAHALPVDVSERFGIKSFLSMAVHPRVGKPWQFGIHQCSYAREWTSGEERLLRAIGRRLADGLTSLSMYRDLQASEAKYRRIVDTANEGIWVFGPDFTTEFANATMAAMLGYTVDELVNRPATDFMLEEDWPEDICEMEKRQNGVSGSYERRFRRKDGRVVWTHASATPVFDDAGRFKGSLAMFADITERKQAEVELRESEARYRALYNKTPVMLDSINRDGRLIAVSDCWLSALGYSREEVLGRRGTDFLSERSRRVAEEVVLPDFMVTGECRDVEYEFVRKDGVVLECLLSAVSERDADGQVLRSLAVITDVTDQKRTDLELRRVNRQLRAISDCNQTLLRATDEQSLLDDICRIVCERAGYRVATVGYVDRALGGAIRAVAFSAADGGDVTGASWLWVDAGGSLGPARTAVRTGRTITVQDLSRSPEFEPWLEDARNRGLRSSIWLPLKDENDDVFGVLLICSAEVNAFSIGEIGLLEGLSGDLAFGAAVLRGRAQQKEAERNIALLSFALNNVRESALLIDEQARFRYVNDESCRVLGYEREELLQRSVYDVDPDFPQERWPAHWSELKAERALLFEGRHQTREGRIFPVEISANYFEYEGQGYNLALVHDISERRQMEDRIRLRERQFRTLAENMPDQLTRFDTEGRIQYVNRRVESDYGITLEQVAGKTLMEVDTPGSPARDRDFFDAVLGAATEGVLNSMEGRWATTRGTRCFEVRHVPEKDADGKVVSVLSIARDITVHKEVEGALRDTARRLSDAQRIAHIGSWDLDLTTNALQWSEETCRIFEIDPENHEPSYEAFLDAIHPEDRKMVDSAFTRSLREGVPYSIDLRIRLSDGRIRHAHAQCETFYDGDRPIRSVGTVQDITERKLAEESLRERESFIRKVLDSVDEGFIVLDRQLRILSANRAFCRTADLAREQVVGEKCHEIVHAPDCWGFGEKCPVQRSFETGTAHSVRHVHMDPSGAERHLELHSFPITDVSGAVMSVIETINDVTEKRKLEDQLRQSQKMEAVGTLAGGVAHDFNNILTAIIWYGNLIQMESSPDDPVQSSAEEILAAADRGAQLTRGLLAFSRKQVINPKPVDLNDVVRNIDKLLRRVIGEDIELSTTVARGDLIVMADAGQIEQVLMNLATNARDAMPDGGALSIATEAIQVDEHFASARGLGKAGGYALIAVSDAGAGMDTQTREKVFEPFFTTKEIGKGTGLGLAIVHGIITQHGGSIEVYSQPGLGTTFKILLPLVSSDPDEADGSSQAPPARGTETILLAEDDPTVRKLITTVLTGYGYRVIGAADGADALEKFSANRNEIDMLILDVVMPRMSGRDVYDAVKAERPDVCALFVSGYTANIIHKKGIFDEGLEFIAKPLGPFDLLRRIRQILDDRK